MEFSPVPRLAVYAELAEFPPALQRGFAADVPRVSVDLRALMFLIGVTPTEMQKKQSALPVPDRYDTEKGWRPRKVSMAVTYGWINGKEPWPPFRLAAAVAMLEVRTMQLGVQLATMPDPDPLLAKRIELAQAHHERLGSDLSLAAGLSLHRLAIHAQLKRNRQKSAQHQRLFELYESLIPTDVLRALAKQKNRV